MNPAPTTDRTTSRPHHVPTATAPTTPAESGITPRLDDNCYCYCDRQRLGVTNGHMNALVRGPFTTLVPQEDQRSPRSAVTYLNVAR